VSAGIVVGGWQSVLYAAGVSGDGENDKMPSSSGGGGGGALREMCGVCSQRARRV